VTGRSARVQVKRVADNSINNAAVLGQNEIAETGARLVFER
jgi:hypothetical protein